MVIKLTAGLCCGRTSFRAACYWTNDKPLLFLRLSDWVKCVKNSASKFTVTLETCLSNSKEGLVAISMLQVNKTFKHGIFAVKDFGV